MGSFFIDGATIIDGSGTPGWAGSVTVTGDRITEVAAESARPGGARPSGAHPEDTRHGEVIDGRGLVVAPGFIDVHSHDDAAVIAAPGHECKTLQGVTSVVVGNCGFSAAPGPDGGTGGVLGAIGFARMRDYLDAVDAAGPAVNVAALVGHNSIRAGVMGGRNPAPASPAELATMLDLLAEALDDGAIGFSSGLEYEPGRYSPASELEAFAQVAAERGGIYTTHMRNERAGLLDSIDESVAVAEATGVSLQISHLKAAGSANHGRVGQALARIDQARARGVDVMADQYPYTRGSTMLEQAVSAGMLDGVEPGQILIAAAPENPAWEGRTLDDLAASHGVSPGDMVDAIVEAEGQGCLVVLDVMSEDDVRTVMAHPMVLTGTDGIPAGSKPHPRLGHSYPRILGRYVRELGLFSVAEAVRRMTSLPAQRFGFADRGVIRPAAFADLVLFDADAIIDTGTWTEPTTAPAGIIGVWVNGERVVDGQSPTGSRPGRTIRRR